MTSTLNHYLIDLGRFLGLVRPPIRSPLVEERIAALVHTCNRHGLTTYASCQGHWLEPSSAYVAFMAPVGHEHTELMARLAHHLYRVQLAGSLKLHWFWRIEIGFRLVPESWQRSPIEGVPPHSDEPYKCVVSYALRPGRSGRLWARLCNAIAPRGRLDSDFLQLGQLLDEMLPQLREADLAIAHGGAFPKSIGVCVKCGAATFAGQPLHTHLTGEASPPFFAHHSTHRSTAAIAH